MRRSIRRSLLALGLPALVTAAVPDTTGASVTPSATRPRVVTSQALRRRLAGGKTFKEKLDELAADNYLAKGMAKWDEFGDKTTEIGKINQALERQTSNLLYAYAGVRNEQKANGDDIRECIASIRDVRVRTKAFKHLFKRVAVEKYRRQLELAIQNERNAIIKQEIDEETEEGLIELIGTFAEYMALALEKGDWDQVDHAKGD